MADGRPEAIADVLEDVGGKPVPTHREGIARGGEDTGVGGADQREEGGCYDREYPQSREHVPGGDLHRRLRGRQRSFGGDPDHHSHDSDVNPGRDDQRSEDPEREVSVGILDLPGDAGDLRYSGIRDEDESRCSENANSATLPEVIETGGFDAR